MPSGNAMSVVRARWVISLTGVIVVIGARFLGGVGLGDVRVRGAADHVGPGRVLLGRLRVLLGRVRAWLGVVGLAGLAFAGLALGGLRPRGLRLGGLRLGRLRLGGLGRLQDA